MNRRGYVEGFQRKMMLKEYHPERFRLHCVYIPLPGSWLLSREYRMKQTRRTLRHFMFLAAASHVIDQKRLCGNPCSSSWRWRQSFTWSCQSYLTMESIFKSKSALQEEKEPKDQRSCMASASGHSYCRKSNNASFILARTERRRIATEKT